MMLQWIRDWPQPLQFIFVGVLAAVVHLMTLMVLVRMLSIAPLLANIPSFFLAFGVSYNGHARLTFEGQNTQGVTAAGRYFLVAILSFLLNEILYAWVLYFLGWSYVPALLLVLLLVAVITFMLSKYWAFAQRHSGC